MLMSLTMRLCPVPPEDSRGATSVVAIPTPSFSSWAEPAAHLIPASQRETFHYNGGCPLRASNRPAVALGEPAWETRKEVRGLKPQFCRTGRCYETYYIVTRVIQQKGPSLVRRSVFAVWRRAARQPLRDHGALPPRALERCRRYSRVLAGRLR